MTTEAAASDHASTTDQQYVKKEKDEGIAQMIASLANEDEVNHDKPEDTPSSKTEDDKPEDNPSSKIEDDKPEDTPSSNTEDEVKTELAAVEVKKSADSPALVASAEDSLKHDKAEDAQSPTPTPTEEDDHKVEPAVAVENTGDSVPSDATVAAQDKAVKEEEKEVVPDLHTISDTKPVHDAANSQPDESPSTEPIVEDIPPEQLQNEPVETDEEKHAQSKTADIPEVSAETIEKTSNIDETNPPTESEGEVVKEAQVLETSAPVEEKLEPVATQAQEKTEAEKKLQKAEQPSTIVVPEPAADAEEKPSDTIEEKETGTSEDVVEETKNFETGPAETVEAEPVFTEVNENQKEPEKPDTSAIPELSAESSDAIVEKTRELDFEAEVLKETNNFETEKEEPVAAKVDENHSETEKAEPVAAKIDESLSEPEKQKEEEKPKTDVPEAEPESAELQGSTEKVKDTGNSEPDAVPEKIEKSEPLSTEVEEKPREQLQVDEEVAEADVETKQEILIETAKTEGTSDDPIKEEKTDKEEETSLTVNAAQVSSNEEPQANLVEPSPEVVLETFKSEGTSDDTVKDEKIDKEEEIRLTENASQVSSNEEPLANLVEPSTEVVFETSKTEGTSDDTIKEEKNLKEEETSLTVNAAQVSSNEEPEENIVEPSPEVAEKVVEEDDKKESSITDVIEGVPNEVASIIKSPEPATIDQGAKPDLKEEREYSVPANLEEKVALAANDDDKKETEAPNAVPGSSTEEEVESRKVEEQNEAKTDTTEAAESVKVENEKGDNDNSVVDDKKEGNNDTKVEEISRAVSEPVRETLASKFEEKEEESVEPGVDKLQKEQAVEPEKTEVQATKESDATKTSKDLPKETPAKPAQKQSNNIISKVKQSLVKARKAITGKSPSSKNLSSEAKGDIKVK